MLEEAEKRDHRKLGKQLDFFHFQDEAPGLVFWHPKGWTIWQQVEQYMRNKYQVNGYQEVKAPQILDASLWGKTGHWDNYRENMFVTESENRSYALKPMNCPGHVQIFNSNMRSTATCRCATASSASATATSRRARCTASCACAASRRMMATSSAPKSRSSRKWWLSTRKRWKCIGLRLPQYRSQAGAASGQPHRLRRIWDKAEEALRAGLRACGVSWTELPGEGAFYGPKIEYHLKDSLGRPGSRHHAGRLLHAGAPGRRVRGGGQQPPGAGHAAPRHRRFAGALHRHPDRKLRGRAAGWLAPVQVSVLNISDAQAEYVQQVAEKLRRCGFRVRPICATRKLTIKYANIPSKNCLTSWLWATKNGMPTPWPCGHGAMSIWASCPSMP
jgi:threonyl-tRNA synthetase